MPVLTTGRARVLIGPRRAGRPRTRLVLVETPPPVTKARMEDQFVVTSHCCTTDPCDARHGLTEFPLLPLVSWCLSSGRPGVPVCLR